MSNKPEVERAARIYVNSQLVGAVVGLLLVLVFGAVFLAQALNNAAETHRVVTDTPPVATCWDYGQPFPPGWSEGDAPLPSCYH